MAAAATLDAGTVRVRAHSKRGGDVVLSEVFLLPKIPFSFGMLLKCPQFWEARRGQRGCGAEGDR